MDPNGVDVFQPADQQFRVNAVADGDHFDFLIADHAAFQGTLVEARLLEALTQRRQHVVDVFADGPVGIHARGDRFDDQRKADCLD